MQQIIKTVATLGHAIHHHRNKTGADLGRAGVNRRFLSELERGKPGGGELEKVLAVLDVSLSLSPPPWWDRCSRIFRLVRCLANRTKPMEASEIHATLAWVSFRINYATHQFPIIFRPEPLKNN
ncbi:hypothetical protein [Thiolapillus sp.]